MARGTKDEVVEPAKGDAATGPPTTSTTIPRANQASFAVTASARPIINLAETNPVDRPGYNPHSASSARGSVQSGLQ